jgi:hypothetical protein
VPWLAQLLLFGGPGAKEAAAACLAELAAVGPDVQQQIRGSGAVATLQNLQSSRERPGCLSPRQLQMVVVLRCCPPLLSVSCV